MKVIGITGGVGAGKSTVLSMLAQLVRCAVVCADDVAKATIRPDGRAYRSVVEALGREAVLPDGTIDRGRMAELIFSDKELCARINAIIHPLTKEAIRERLAQAEADGCDYAFVEAALLIEAGYQDICDEFWYIYAPEETRIRRLTKSRGYSPQKCRDIMKNQLSDGEYRKNCGYVIDNSKNNEETKRQLIEGLKRVSGSGKVGGWHG